MIDPIMNIWDSMALIPVIKGAGGIITDYEGNDPVNGNSIVASTPLLHNEIIKNLS
jgi:myo-inositol-1(or 4)-monophosphatase